MKHTPGPWHQRQIFDLHHSWYDYTKITANMGNHTIGIVQSESMEQDEADGRLIAASPELLEACKLMDEQLDMEQPTRWVEARSALKKAIAKATLDK